MAIQRSRFSTALPTCYGRSMVAPRNTRTWLCSTMRLSFDACVAGFPLMSWRIDPDSWRSYRLVTVVWVCVPGRPLLMQRRWHPGCTRRLHCHPTTHGPLVPSRVCSCRRPCTTRYPGTWRALWRPSFASTQRLRELRQSWSPAPNEELLDTCNDGSRRNCI